MHTFAVNGQHLPLLNDVDCALHFLPSVNAGLNMTAAILLLAGWAAIKKKRQKLHRNLMLSAFAVSATFLVSYVAYHVTQGDTKYTGTGAARIVYFAVLVSHVVCSLAVVPSAFFALHYAWKRDFVRHRRLTRWLHPLWLYVSVTGVVVYLMLRPYYSMRNAP